MDNYDLFVSIFSIGVGLFSILASIFNWEFFFESRKARLFNSILGRTGSRIFYAILGLVLLFFGYRILYP